MKPYEAPCLYVDSFAPDTSVASSQPKNGNADNNQYCWGCRLSPGATDSQDPTHACCYTPGDGVYGRYCI